MKGFEAMTLVMALHEVVTRTVEKKAASVPTVA